MTIAYLDVDDEITNAVARLRHSEELRVALVLPPGSRIATSRINFRLLAREARERQRLLSIVTPEPGVRAVAVSAGLPAYASVADYERALAEEAGQGAAGLGVPGAAGAAAAGAAGAAAAGAAGPATTPDSSGPAPAGAAAAGPAAPPGRLPLETAAQSTPASAAGAPGATPPAGSGGPGAAGRAAAPSGAGAGPTKVMAVPLEAAGAIGAEAGRAGRSPTLPVVGGARTLGEGRGRRGLALAIGAAAIVVVLVAVAAFLLLPSAAITVTPLGVPVGPVTLTVTADPAATAVDAAHGIVPAQAVQVPVQASGTFAATGVKVTETSATGTVTFTSNNTANPVTIRSGTQVSTGSGVGFATTATVVVPRAKVRGNNIERGTVNAPIQALQSGTAGNVAAHAINQVSNSVQIALVNPDNPVDNAAPTSGGTHTETAVVAQKDYDAALKALTTQLQTALDQQLAAPGTAPQGVTLVPATATLGPATADKPASALVGTAATTFPLTLSAVGTVTGVDESQLAPLAEQKLRANVPSGLELFADSIKTSVGDARPSGDKVSFDLTASGEGWKPVQASTLLPLVKGKSVAEAQRLLAPYGDVHISTWPGYVTTIPTLDMRVQLTVASPRRAGQ